MNGCKSCAKKNIVFFSSLLLSSLDDDFWTILFSQSVWYIGEYIVYLIVKSIVFTFVLVIWILWFSIKIYQVEITTWNPNNNNNILEHPSHTHIQYRFTIFSPSRLISYQFFVCFNILRYTSLYFSFWFSFRLFPNVLISSQEKKDSRVSETKERQMKKWNGKKRYSQNEKKLLFLLFLNESNWQLMKKKEKEKKVNNNNQK